MIDNENRMLEYIKLDIQRATAIANMRVILFEWLEKKLPLTDRQIAVWEIKAFLVQSVTARIPMSDIFGEGEEERALAIADIELTMFLQERMMVKH